MYVIDCYPSFGLFMNEFRCPAIKTWPRCMRNKLHLHVMTSYRLYEMQVTHSVMHEMQGTLSVFHGMKMTNSLLVVTYKAT